MTDTNKDTPSPYPLASDALGRVQTTQHQRTFEHLIQQMEGLLPEKPRKVMKRLFSTLAIKCPQVATQLYLGVREVMHHGSPRLFVDFVDPRVAESFSSGTSEQPTVFMKIIFDDTLNISFDVLKQLTTDPDLRKAHLEFHLNRYCGLFPGVNLRHELAIMSVEALRMLVSECGYIPFVSRIGDLGDTQVLIITLALPDVEQHMVSVVLDYSVLLTGQAEDTKNQLLQGVMKK
jgi:hypothetical protein